MKANLLKGVPQDLLKKWFDMTDNNEHIDVRIAIARYFMGFEKSFDLYVKLFSALKRQKEYAIKNRMQYTMRTDWLGNENAITDKMFEDIEYIFGKEIAESVCTSL